MSDKDPSGKLGHEASDMTEEEFLRAYRREEYPRPSVTVDLVIFTILDNDLKVLLIRRKGHPFKGFWSIPGGFVDVGDAIQNQGESIEAAAHRELAEETGLPKGSCYLEQLYTFGTPGRDPRTRVISVAHFALIPPDKAALVQAGSDAAEVRWFSVEALDRNGVYQTPTGERVLVTNVTGSVPLAFDHAEILRMAVTRLRNKIDYTTVAFELVPPTFSVAQLRAVYEVVKGTAFDPSNFRRRFTRMQVDKLIESAPGKQSTGGRRATVYRFVRPNEP
jgi:8-oxo-dGTP diphosphatase